MKVSIRLALPGEILYEWDSSEVGELRVWELKQRFCQVTNTGEYFAWQLYDARRLLKDHHFVANIANNAETGLSLFAIKRKLRPPTLDERADILYYVSICHRRKLWRLVAQGIEVKEIAGTSDKTCTLVRAIEANYVERSENYSFPDTVQTLLWAQCDPNQAGRDQRLPLNQAIRSGDDRAVEQLLRAQANPMRAETGHEAPLLLAVRVGAPSYVRLLLQHRAVPLRPADVYGSTASVNEKKEDMARVMQIASSTPASVAILEMALSEQPSSAAQGY